ncbi:MAG: NAD(P)H-dependent oxidoreductase [Gemmatimonadota bacterium]
MSARRAVLLVGSARPPGTGNSEALASYLLARLVEGGMETEVFHVHRCQRPEKERALFEAVDGADLFVLSTPLYVDALPYLVTRCCERMATHRAVEPKEKRSRMVALVNCGFPELEHTLIALDICRVFAREAGFVWAGGLGLGGGEAIGGKPLEEVGSTTRHVRSGLDLAAEALLADRVIPEESQALLARPMIPFRMYTTLGDIGWLRTARKKGTLRRLWDRPLG